MNRAATVALLVCLTALACCQAGAAADERAVLVNWYAPLVDDDAASSLELRPLFEQLQAKGIDATLRARKGAKEEMSGRLSRDLSPWIHPLSTGMAAGANKAATLQEQMRSVSAAKAARARALHINVVAVNDGTDGALPVAMLPAHYNVLRLRFGGGDAFLPQPDVAMQPFVSWDEVWVSTAAERQTLVNATERWAVQLAHIQLRHHLNSAGDSDEYAARFELEKASLLATLPPVRVMPTAIDAGRWRYYRDDVAKVPVGDGQLGRVGPYALPSASFRLLSVVDMRRSDWKVGPREFLSLRTKSTDGAHYVLVVEAPPRPNMTAAELHDYVRAELYSAVDPDYSVVTFNFTEDGPRQIPTPLPDTISVLYSDGGDGRLSDADMLHLINNCHLYVALSLGPHTETYLLRAMAAELPILTLAAGWPKAVLSDYSAFVLPDVGAKHGQAPKFDLKSLRSVIEALMQPEATNRLRTAAIHANELLRSKFSHERVGVTLAKRIKNIVKKLTADQPVAHLPKLLSSPRDQASDTATWSSTFQD